MRKYGLLFLFIIFTTSLFAQRLVSICGEYTYYSPENMSLEAAKQEALRLAKITALADKFGTVVSQNTSIVKKEKNGQGDEKYLSILSDEAKGEWVADTKDPEYEISYKDGVLVVKASICGKAKEIVQSKIDLDVRLLQNGYDIRNESDIFKDGDRFYLWVQTPQKGYVAVYLIDETPNAYCLLPYQGNTDGWVAIENNKPYIFFSQAHAMAQESVDEMILTCSKESEQNQIYVIFSPNQFIKANDILKSEQMPRELSYKDFNKWLINNQNKDKKMQVIKKSVLINSNH